MYILRDLYLEVNDLSAQIEYLIITRHRIYVLECKNLIGNIEIDNTGHFIRTFEINSKKVKEGIYSPITQNERYLNVIKEMRLSEQKNFIGKTIIEKSFNNDYKSLVVLANPKTLLFDRFAKKEIKNKVIRSDQLIQRLKELEKVSKQYKDSTSKGSKVFEVKNKAKILKEDLVNKKAILESLKGKYIRLDELKKQVYYNIDSEIYQSIKNVNIDESDIKASVWNIWNKYFEFLLMNPTKTKYYKNFRNSNLYISHDHAEDNDHYHTIMSAINEISERFGLYQKINYDVLWFFIIDNSLSFAMRISDGSIENTEKNKQTIFNIIFNQIIDELKKEDENG